MNDLELEREIRATFRRRGVDVLDPQAIPPAREVLRRTRRHQLTNIVTAVVVTVAVAAASIAGATALIRSSERRVPAEPPDTFEPGSLQAVEAQPVSLGGLADTDGRFWSGGNGLTVFDPATGSLRTFTLADDPAFAGANPAAPARQGGVWVVSDVAGGEQVVRRFDGERFVETTAPGPRLHRPGRGGARRHPLGGGRGRGLLVERRSVARGALDRASLAVRGRPRG
jgi:hypothetical protein